jgi:hypothetical protein
MMPGQDERAMTCLYCCCSKFALAERLERR